MYQNRTIGSHTTNSVKAVKGT